MVEAHDSNGPSRIVTIATCFLLYFGGILVRSTLDGNLTTLVKEYNEGNVGRRLQDEPRVFHEANDLTDQHLERYSMVKIHFRNNENPERNQKLVLNVEGFDRYTMTEPDEEGIQEEYVFGYVNNTDYHSIQLLRANHNVTGTVKQGRRRKLLWNVVNDWKRKVANTWNTVKNLGRWINDKRRAISNALRDATNFRKWWNQAKSAASSAWNKVKGLKNQIAAKMKEIFNFKQWIAAAKKAATAGWNKVTNLGNTLKGYAKKIADIPGLIKRKIIDPVHKDITGVFKDVFKIDTIANALAKTAISVIKQLKFLPDSGKALANLLKSSLLGNFKNGICVPYNVIAKRFKINRKPVNINNPIELYKNSFASISTKVTPSTCLDIADIQFDISKLTNFLNPFKNLKALKDIFDKVTKFIGDTMKKVLSFAGDIGSIFKQIEKTVNGILSSIGLKRHLELEESWDATGRVLSGDELVEKAELGHYSNLTIGDAQIIAYHAGRMKFEQLYGEHVKKVFQEERMLARGKSFIGFSSLKLRLRANFKQDLTLQAAKRTGYAKQIFDETLHQSAKIPFFGGLLNIVAGGSVEGSMPYAITLDANGKAVFGYEVGQVTATVDIITQRFTFDKRPFATKANLDAKVGLSGYMALKFAASASLGICLGPTQDACLTVSIDSKQETAAGFDAYADLKWDKNNKSVKSEASQLESMYQDKIAYPKNKCSGNLGMSVGYWQYVMSPSVKVSLTGTSFDDLDVTLYEFKARILQSSIKSWCIALPFKFRNRRLGQSQSEGVELPELPQGVVEIPEEEELPQEEQLP